MPANRQDLQNGSIGGYTLVSMLLCILSVSVFYRALFQLAVTQAGYFTAAQAREIGYSYQAQHYHAQRGNWVRVDRGIYRLFVWPVGAHDDLVRWTLWAGEQAVVSHKTALNVHRIGEFSPARVHLTAPRGFSKRAVGVVIHTVALGRAGSGSRRAHAPSAS